MALKIYGAKETHTGVEFVLRGHTLEGAQEAADILLSEINTSGTLIAGNFTGPQRIASSLKMSLLTGTHNADIPIDPIIPIENYVAVILDHSDNSYCSTPYDVTTDFRENFQIIAWIEFLNYAGDGVQVIASKWDESSDDRVWRLYMDDDFLKADVSIDGINIASNGAAGADIAIVHDTPIWVRMEYLTLLGGSTILQLSTSDQSRFLEPDKLTWNVVATNTIGESPVLLHEDVTHGIIVGANTLGAAGTETDVPNGNIGRVVLADSTPDDPFAISIQADMYPSRDYNLVTNPRMWTSQTNEEWTLNGRAVVGVPISGGTTLAISLDGDPTSFVSAPDGVSPFVSGFSVAVWAQFSAGDGLAYPLISRGDNLDFINFSYYYLLEDDFENRGTISSGTSLQSITSNTIGEIPAGIWYGWNSDGAGGTKFYTSEDDIDTPFADINWVVNFTSAASIQDFNNLDTTYNVGSFPGTTSDSLVGKIARALVIEGDINAGTLHREMYPDRDYEDGDDWASSTTFETWTFQGNATLGVIE